MTEQTFQPGELVNIRIEGARVIEAWDITGTPWLSVNYDRGTGDISVCLDRRSVTVERVAPKEWPPQPGDIWQDREGDEWHAMGDGANPGHVDLWNMQDGSQFELHTVVGNWGPLTLVRRRGWTPTPATEERPEPQQVDQRAARIAGLRALIHLLETRTDLPVPYGIRGQIGFRGPEGLAEARRLAASLGIQFDTPYDTGNDEQRWATSADLDLGGNVSVCLYVSRLDPPEPDADGEATS